MALHLLQELLHKDFERTGLHHSLVAWAIQATLWRGFNANVLKPLVFTAGINFLPEFNLFSVSFT